MRRFLIIAIINAIAISSHATAVEARIIPYKKGDLARFGLWVYRELKNYRLGDMNRLASKAGQDYRRHLDEEHNRRLREAAPAGTYAAINYQPAQAVKQAGSQVASQQPARKRSQAQSTNYRHSQRAYRQYGSRSFRSYRFRRY